MQFFLPKGAIDFDVVVFGIYSYFTKYTTNLPLSSPYYSVIASEAKGSAEEVSDLCDNVFNILLNKLSENIGQVIDRPHITENKNNNPPGCEDDCPQKFNEIITETYFKSNNNVTLRKADGTLTNNIDHGEGHHSPTYTRSCNINVIVNKPKLLKK